MILEILGVLVILEVSSRPVHGSGLCPTCYRPDHFRSSKPRPVVDPPEAMVRVVRRCRFPIGFWSSLDYANRCQNLLIFARLTGFRRDLGESQRDEAKS